MYTGALSLLHDTHVVCFRPGLKYFNAPRDNERHLSGGVINNTTVSFGETVNDK